MSHNHFDLICEQCRKRIGGCRCMDGNKTQQTAGLCDSCKAPVSPILDEPKGPSDEVKSLRLENARLFEMVQNLTITKNDLELKALREAPKGMTKEDAEKLIEAYGVAYRELKRIPSVFTEGKAAAERDVKETKAALLSALIGAPQAKYDKLERRYDALVDECDMKRKRIEELESKAPQASEADLEAIKAAFQLLVSWTVNLGMPEKSAEITINGETAWYRVESDWRALVAG